MATQRNRYPYTPPPARGSSAAGVTSRFGPPLSQWDFALHLLCAVIAVSLCNWFLPELITVSRQEGLWTRAWVLHATAIGANFVGFWYVSRLFVRRLLDLSGENDIGFFTRAWLKFSLLSPLLGFQVTAIALLARGSESGEYQKPGFVSKLLAFCASLLAVHAGWIAFLLARGRVHFDFKTLQLIPVSRTLDASSAALEKAVHEAGWLAPLGGTRTMIMVHVLPYLNSSFRMGAAALSDFERAAALYDLADDARSDICRQKKNYLGFQVDDCYWSAYQRLSQTEPFVSPWPALMYELRRRQTLQKTAASSVPASVKAQASAQSSVAALTSSPGQPSISDTSQNPGQEPMSTGTASVQELQQKARMQVATAAASFAQGLLTLENIANILEGRAGRRSVRDATWPQGFLLAWGNVEIATIELLQDVQKLIVAKRVAAQVLAHLPEIQASLEQSRSVFPDDVMKKFGLKIDEIESRLTALTNMPVVGGAVF